MSDILHVTPVMPVDELHIERALDSTEHAGSLVTSWVPSPFEHALLRAVPALWRKVRREPVLLKHRRVVRHLWPDVRHLIDLRAHLLESDLLAHDEFFNRVDRNASALVAPSTRMVIGREFGCEQTFRRAQNLGVTRLYHLPTVDHDTLRAILDKEQALFADICSSTFDPFEFHPNHILSKREEIVMADKILCPSEFVKQSLLDAGVEDTKISVTPFGSETDWLEAPRTEGSSKTFVFVGNISVRKGAHRLLQVWKQLGAFRTHKLLMVGDMHLTPAFLKDYAGMYDHLPRLPREDLRDIYLQADALVLPALAEGFALVIQEALSCGTPVLASLHSGAAGFLNDEQARLFAAQDNDALGAAMEWALTYPAMLAEMGLAGRARAQEWTWRSFESMICQQVEALLAAKHPHD